MSVDSCFFSSELCSFIIPVGIELISPILRFNESRFRDLVRGVWDRISRSCTISTNESCGTHVHISQDTGFHVLDAMAIARAVLHFEPAINALVPPHRRDPGAEYCKTFFGHDKKFQGMTPTQAIAKVNTIDRDEDVPPFVELNEFTDPFGETFAHPIAKLMNPGGDRSYTWNFTSLPRTSTIEFRQPPGVKTAAETLQWVEFAITFVKAALLKAKPDDNLEAFNVNVGGLKEFLKIKAEDFPREPANFFATCDGSILEQLFDGVNDLAREPPLL